MRAAAAGAALALAIAGAGAAGSTSPRAATGQSGLHGLVTRGPVAPVCRAGVPCDEPAAHATFLLLRHGKSFRVRTDDRGRYRVRLAPGRYTIAKPDWGPGSIRPTSARVPRGRFVRVNLFIDTGIR